MAHNSSSAIDLGYSPSEFTIRDGFDTSLTLHLYDILDCHVFDGLEIIRGKFVLFEEIALVQQLPWALERAYVLSAVRREEFVVRHVVVRR